MKKILLEICCGSIDDAVQAQAGGADRVELCSALFLGGLTPSLGTLIETRKRLKIPIIAMVRPRGGGFCYTDAEIATMERDARLAVDNGADGVVAGILKEDGTVHEAHCHRIREAIGAREAVFHRAFDVTPDPIQALDQIINLGFTRVLTSGQQNSVPEGMELIRKLIKHARNRIEILPGGGIPNYALRDVVEKTGCSQVHITAFGSRIDRSTERRPFITFGGALYPPENQFLMTDRSLVQQMVESLKH